MFEQFKEKVLEVVGGTLAQLKTLKWHDFVLHFWSTSMFVLGLFAEVLLKVRSIFAEFSEIPYAQKRQYIIDLVNEHLGVPGPNEEQEAALIGSLFDVVAGWVGQQTGSVFGSVEAKEAAPSDEEILASFAPYTYFQRKLEEHAG